jgi:hypothetical protein
MTGLLVVIWALGVGYWARGARAEGFGGGGLEG